MNADTWMLQLKCLQLLKCIHTYISHVESGKQYSGETIRDTATTFLFQYIPQFQLQFGHTSKQTVIKKNIHNHIINKLLPFFTFT